MSTPAESNEVSSSLSKLSIDPATGSTKPTQKKSKKVVVDSWEDEDDSEPDVEVEEDKTAASSASVTHPVPSPPPPTPSSPPEAGWSSTSGAASPRYSTDPGKRPEKTDAVARRMIVAGLGLKAPKQTDEQRAYQKSVREQEKKRREQEKAEEQKRRDESEKAKAAIWDD